MSVTAAELLDAATGVDTWLSKYQRETDNGCGWGLAREVPEKTIRTLYLGSAGIAIYYLELFKATGEQRYLDVAMQAGADIEKYVLSKDTMLISTHGGWAGYFFALNELDKASGTTTFAETATHCAQKLRDQGSDCGKGLGWIAQMPYTNKPGTREIYDVAEGAAGIGIYYLYAHEENIHPDSLTWVKAIADRLIEIAEPAEGGVRWQLMDDIPWPFDAPNFAHGTAGVAYFLARTSQVTGDQSYLETAMAGARHVQAMAEDKGENAHLVPHILNDGRDHRYYLGFCHGPAGTSRLYYLLGDMTGDSAWTEWGHGLGRGLLTTGAPEERSRGFWNNISQCCCDAGIGDYATWMYRATGDDMYLGLAQRVAAELLRRADTSEGGFCWPQAEHRSQPDFIQAQTGYMQGAAGVGSFLLHLATTMNGSPVKVRFPETPVEWVR